MIHGGDYRFCKHCGSMTDLGTGALVDLTKTYNATPLRQEPRHGADLPELEEWRRSEEGGTNG